MIGPASMFFPSDYFCMHLASLVEQVSLSWNDFVTYTIDVFHPKLAYLYGLWDAVSKIMLFD